MILFVSGTDTGVGKTYVAAELIRAAVAGGIKVSVCKPIACGTETSGIGKVSADAMLLMKAAGIDESEYSEVNPVLFAEPISPHLAAKKELHPVDVKMLEQHITKLSDAVDLLIVEGVGGIACPISDDITWADFISSAFPGSKTVLVAAPGVGTLNHTIMSLDYLVARRLTCNDIVLSAFDGNDLRHCENRTELNTLTGRNIYVCHQDGSLDDALQLITSSGYPRQGA